MPQEEENTLKIRKIWKINPKTRIRESRKKYKRSSEKKAKVKEIKQGMQKEFPPAEKNLRKLKVNGRREQCGRTKIKKQDN